jgi:hypothetical protein
MVQRWVEQCQNIAADISDGSDVDVDVMARRCGWSTFKHTNTPASTRMMKHAIKQGVEV